MLFTARFRGKPIFIHLLFEHQRTADAWMPLRLLNYQLRIWERFRKDKPKAKRLLLQRLLTRKFGELDYLTLQKLDRAGTKDLERWGERILDAKTLDEVFES